MDTFQILIALIFLASILVGVAQKIRIPYPIVLVLGGIVIGFIPNLQAIYLDPNLILFVVLPPILYYAAFSLSIREFKKNWKEIFSLALGLVVMTTLIVGVIFKWIFPEFPWALAFAFGAIISPPDSVAATTILKRFAISPRLLAVLEGESLINDASALILYKFSVVALLTGIFSFTEASMEFVKVVAGGTILGLISGFILQNFSRRFLDPIPGILFSFTIPYMTFILAQWLDVSGVLAVVVNGLIGSGILAKHPVSLRRVLGFTFWDIFIILLNCFIFVLIGLQLRSLVSQMSGKQIGLYIVYSLLMTIALIVIRMLWVYSKSGFAYFQAFTNPKKCDQCPQILREAAILGWSGMRGIVSLTAALALPYTHPNGTPIQGREEVIFMTFVVILITLLLPSSTLPYLINLLKINHHHGHHEAHKARKHLAKVAEEHISLLHETKNINDRELSFLKSYFASQRYLFEISDTNLKKMSQLEIVRLKVFQAQRKELVAMWDRQDVDDRLFRQLEHELDVEESHISRANL